MAFGQNMQEITLKVRAEGRGEVGAMRQELNKLEDAVAGFWGKIAEGGGKEGVTHWVNQIGSADRAMRTLREALAQTDPDQQKLIQSSRNVANAMAEQAEAARKLAADRTEAAERVLAAEQLAAQKAKALSEEEVARRKEAAERILAAEQLAAQRIQALRDQEADRRKEAAEKILAAEQLADQRRATLSADEVARRRADADKILSIEQLAVQKRESLAADAAARASLQMQKQAAEQEAIARQAFEFIDRHGFVEKNPFWSSGAIKGTYEQGRAYGEQKKKLDELNRSHEAGGESAKKFGYGLLNVAHAVQDAQYGMGALLNNVPLVVQALGGGPGLAGTVMVLGVALEQLGPKLLEVAQGFRATVDPTRAIVATLADAKDRLAALTEKSWKVAVDYEAIERGKVQVAELEARLAAYQSAAREQTDTQQKVAKMVRTSVVEEAGAGDVVGGTENLVRIMAEGLRRQGRFGQRDPQFEELQRLRGQFADTEREMADPEFRKDPAMVQGAAAMQARLGPKIAAMQAEIEARQMQRIREEVVGGALRGEQNPINQVLNMMKERPDVFAGDAARGLLPVTGKFAVGLRDANPAHVKGSAEEAARLEAEQKRGVAAFDAAKKAQAKRETEETRAFTVQGKVGEEAFDEGQRIRSKSPVGFEFKPLERMTAPAAVDRRAFRGRQLNQMQGMGQEIAQARPDLSQQQVMGAAQRANQLVGQGWNRAAAMNEALLRLNQELFQTMQMMQARQMGFTGSVGQLRQQNRRMQQQRPTLLPTFPGGF